MLAHIVLIIWGYAGGSLPHVPAETWRMTFDDPGMLLAVAGTLCLVMVVVTSIRAARARLRYESWHLLHLYAYLGVGLALPHQLWTGQEFLASTASTVFWWTAWAAPARPSSCSASRCRCSASLATASASPRSWPRAADVVSVHLTGRDLHRLRAEAGQFFVWRFLAGDGRYAWQPILAVRGADRRHACASPSRTSATRAAGCGPAPGTRVMFEGPYGRLGDRARTRDKVAFIGAGVGITPLRALAEGMDYEPGEAVMLQRYRDEPLMSARAGGAGPHRGLELLWLPGHRRSDDSWLGAHAGAPTT